VYDLIIFTCARADLQEYYANTGALQQAAWMICMDDLIIVPCARADSQEYYANTGALQQAASSARGGRAPGVSIVEAFGKEVKPRELKDVLRIEYRCVCVCVHALLPEQKNLLCLQSTSLCLKCFSHGAANTYTLKRVTQNYVAASCACCSCTFVRACDVQLKACAVAFACEVCLSCISELEQLGCLDLADMLCVRAHDVQDEVAEPKVG